MSTTPPFQMGQQGSRSAFVAALTALQSQGEGVITTLMQDNIDLLIEFQRRQGAVNARRVRSNRIYTAEQAVKFVVSDFEDIDQADTTGTIRADSQSVSLRERAVPAEASAKTTKFSSSTGDIEALNAAQTILRVHTVDGSTPTGQFDIQLVTPLTINQLVVDIVATPSEPSVVVSTSQDGLTYIQATQLALNGNRITVWLASLEVKYIRIQITPSHPDDLNGDLFTFGIIDFSAQSTQFQLRSEFVTKPIMFAPKSQYVVLDAPVIPGVQYFLSLSIPGTTAPLVEITPGKYIQVPGTMAFNEPGVAIDDTGLFAHTLPGDAYLTTLSVVDGGTGLPMKLAPGLSHIDINVSKLTNEYVGIESRSVDSSLYLVKHNFNGSVDPGRTFDISYVSGPPEVVVQLQVQLSTTDNSTSPIFQGASLDEV